MSHEVLGGPSLRTILASCMREIISRSVVFKESNLGSGGGEGGEGGESGEGGEVGIFRFCGGKRLVLEMYMWGVGEEGSGLLATILERPIGSES